MSSVSGWCSGPLGSRLKCDWCRSDLCAHDCHERPVVERESRSAAVELGQQKRPLGGASTPLVQGASPTSKESTDD